MAQEIQSLKKNFIMAKQYKLHTALEHVSKNSMKEQQRLQRIIAHMQAEKIALQALLQQAEDDRDASTMRLQLAKEENDRIMHGANARVNENFVSPHPAESHSYDHINSNNNQLQISVIPEPAMACYISVLARDIASRQLARFMTIVLSYVDDIPLVCRRFKLSVYFLYDKYCSDFLLQ